MILYVLPDVLFFLSRISSNFWFTLHSLKTISLASLPGKNVSYLFSFPTTKLQCVSIQCDADTFLLLPLQRDKLTFVRSQVLRQRLKRHQFSLLARVRAGKICCMQENGLFSASPKHDSKILDVFHCEPGEFRIKPFRIYIPAQALFQPQYLVLTYLFVNKAL